MESTLQPIQTENEARNIIVDDDTEIEKALEVVDQFS